MLLFLAQTVCLNIRSFKDLISVKSDIIDQRSLKFKFVELTPAEHSLTNDQLILSDTNGRKNSLRFPGCYRIFLEFKLKRPLDNPYIETFIKMGTNLPCQTESVHEIKTSAHSLCTNMSHPVDWCPRSKNKQLRGALRDKTTWYK